MTRTGVLAELAERKREGDLVADALHDFLPTGARMDEQGLHLPPNLPWSDYVALGGRLVWLHDKFSQAVSLLNFAIGDWLVYGEHVYGEKYHQASEATGKSVTRLKNLRWVASHVPKGRRRPFELSFEHHVEVAALPPDQQRELLDRAVKEDLTREDLRNEKHRLGKSAADYNLDEAKLALNTAADMLAQVPWQEWCKLIMNILVKPLRHEVDRIQYKAFVAELFDMVRILRDRA